mmetsp:Transcript_1617/g.3530  ORF Transcript_1617/g.3530 Transcript_1617/m.3530 type:complete len:526 (-) Transcript_1617:35-1612(-)|eukprot:CAMPEP_0206583112 /NCGR_PEP_ID=MMETSP0325_2-20121206/34902_1 /ASSEMBLY_ACC=CAM_ASM_000347 /TAXON_ID=2866 /ORGANISM="Crypthecodinium cohnii, Strain Seligo" /LENGTH=525 /DNA_ID=CAMNT_0054089955 /DNA_START=59 /DNA_END=1636 /DNA_ORIENTATION=+
MASQCLTARGPRPARLPPVAPGSLSARRFETPQDLVVGTKLSIRSATPTGRVISDDPTKVLEVPIPPPRAASSASNRRPQPQLSARLDRSRFDPAPCVPPAGKSIFEPGGVHFETPQTPDSWSKLRARHRQRERPGERAVHWGLKEVPFPSPGRGYGRAMAKDVGVAQTFRAGQKLGVAEYRNQVGEAVYQSTIKEPLGKGWCRGHSLPPETEAPEFPGFGVPIERSADVKETMFPRNVVPNSEEVRQRYIKTHQSWDAGEMEKRDYKWPEGVDPERWRFGAVELVKDSDNRGSGVRSALRLDLGQEQLSVPRTRLADATLEHYRYAARDHEGKCRHLLQTATELPPEHFFGKPTCRGETNVALLIHDALPLEEQQPDHDLGKCTARGRMNHLTKNPLGAPTIRTDLVPKPRHLRSIANTINFGDDDDAKALIAPGRFQAQNIFNDDFLRPRDEEELKSILAGSGHAVADEEFEEIMDRAATLSIVTGSGAQPNQATVQCLMAAYSEFVAQKTARPANSLVTAMA